MSRLAVGAALICTLMVLGGCARKLAVVEEAYSGDSERAKSRASSIIFVPGIMGVELHDSRDGRVVWGTFWEREQSIQDLVRVALPFSTETPVSELYDTLEPGGQLLVANLTVGGREIHARGYPGVLEGMFQELVEGGQHRHPKAISKDDAMAGRNPIIGFGYDWRHDIATETRRFHKAVVAASEERFRRTGSRRIDVIAHSMGTQLVRWYIRYGTAPVPTDGTLPELTWAGAELIERVLLVGAPNSGSARALNVLLAGWRASVLLPRYPSAIIATFPSAFELIPRPEDQVVVWMKTGAPVPLYDVRTWEKLRWGPFADNQDEFLQVLMPERATREERLAVLRRHVGRCLSNARAFHRALDRHAEPPPHIRVHTFAGDALATKAILKVDPETGRAKWAGDEPGDGTVTRSSALGRVRSDPDAPARVQSSSVHFNGADHLSMVADPAFLDQALYLLLEAPDPPPP